MTDFWALLLGSEVVVSFYTAFWVCGTALACALHKENEFVELPKEKKTESGSDCLRCKPMLRHVFDGQKYLIQASAWPWRRHRELRDDNGTFIGLE